MPANYLQNPVIIPNSDQSLTNPGNMSVKSNGNSKKVLIIVGLIFIGLLISIPLIFMLIQKSKPQNLIQTLDNRVINLPLSPQDPDLHEVGYIYGFDTIILNLEQTSKGLIISTPVKKTGIPEFILTGTGMVYFIKDNQLVETSFDKLKVGQNIRLSIFYSITRKRWNLSRVVIKDDLGIKTATDSSKTQ